MPKQAKNKTQKAKIDEIKRRKIKAAMVGKGIVAAAIARDLGITPMAVYHVTSGRKRIKRVIQALVDAGVPAGLFNAAK